MEYDIVVLDVGIMFMAVPVAGSHMNLYVPSYQTRLICDNRIPKIGTVVTVDSARVDYVELFALGGSQLGPYGLLPY